MTWAKIDDAFTDHPKVAALSHGAFRLHVAGICHAARFLTDGMVPLAQVARLVPAYRPVFLSEVLAAVWHADGHSCGDCAQPGPTQAVIHDYLVYNPSRAKVIAEREATAERQRRLRESRRDNHRDDAVTHTVTNGVSPPSPTRPDPEGIPPTPASGGTNGSAHHGQHPRCRLCGTNPRAKTAPDPLARPPVRDVAAVLAEHAPDPAELPDDPLTKIAAARAGLPNHPPDAA